MSSARRCSARLQQLSCVSPLLSLVSLLLETRNEIYELLLKATLRMLQSYASDLLGPHTMVPRDRQEWQYSDIPDLAHTTTWQQST